MWKLEPGKEKYLRVATLNPENNLGTVVNYYQFGPLDIRTTCLLDLIRVIFFLNLDYQISFFSII